MADGHVLQIPSTPKSGYPYPHCYNYTGTFGNEAGVSGNTYFSGKGTKRNGKIR